MGFSHRYWFIIENFFLNILSGRIFVEYSDISFGSFRSCLFTRISGESFSDWFMLLVSYRRMFVDRCTDVSFDHPLCFW